MPTARNKRKKSLSRLLARVPKGNWAAISPDEKRVVAHAASLALVLRKAKEAGEQTPFVIRIPVKNLPLVL